MGNESSYRGTEINKKAASKATQVFLANHVDFQRVHVLLLSLEHNTFVAVNTGIQSHLPVISSTERVLQL